MSKAELGKVLIVDDEANLRRVLARELAAVGYQTVEAGDGEAALAALADDEFEVVLLDLKMPGRGGLEVLAEVKQRWPLVEVIILTGHGSVDTAIEAMRAGAYDYQQKPCHLDELEVLVGKAFRKRALEVRSLALAGGSSGGAIEWGQSEAMARVRHDVEKVAATDVPVLILGESGTGKELVAREIHTASHLAEQPFVTVNCGAISPSLVESALFGHEKGAFTGADRRRPGLVEAADGGTLFLDELGELPLDMQVKLLRFLQFGEVQRVGAAKASKVNVRVLAATNADATCGSTSPSASSCRRCASARATWRSSSRASSASWPPRGARPGRSAPKAWPSSSATVGRATCASCGPPSSGWSCWPTPT